MTKKMQKLHNHLLETSSFYRFWDNHKASTFFHWYVFLIVTSFVGLSLLGNINQYSRENLAAANAATPPEEYVLVKFKSNASFEKKNIAIARHGLKEQSELKQIGVKQFKVPPGKGAKDVANEIVATDGDSIEFAEADAKDAPGIVPNDPYFAGSQTDKVMMNLPAAWDQTVGDSNIVIAVLDSGIDCNHEDFAGSCIAGWNVVENNSNTSPTWSHGTAAAGVAAARGNNGVGVAGGVWNSKIMPVKITAGSDTWSFASKEASGIIWAADHGAKVISMSYAGKFQSVFEAASYAASKGAVVVQSAGNTGVSSGINDMPNTIVVGAAYAPDGIEGYSTYGNDVDIAAPSCTSGTTYPGNGYGGFCGTSNSTPEIAGVLALIRSANSSLSPAQVRDVLYSTAIDSGATGRDSYFGWGFVNAAAAVTKAKSMSGSTPPPAAPVAPSLSASTSNSCGGYINLSWGSVSGATSYKLYRNGNLINSSVTSPYTDSGLTSGSTYSYTVQASNSSGDSQFSNTASAVASAVCPPTLPTLSIIKPEVTNRTSNSATITWQTSLPSTGVVLYGRSVNILVTVGSGGSLSTNHSIQLVGLTPNTRYYYKVVANNEDLGLTASTGLFQFRTSNNKN